MRQEINLFQSTLRPQKRPFSAKNMVMLTAFFLFVFTGIYVFSLQQLGVVESKISSINIELGKSRDQIEQLVKQFPENSENKLLATEIARLNSELEKRHAISKALKKYSLENTRVFSALLESLARKHVKGTWLTKVSISDGGESLGFEGKTYSSELVPVYIQRLSEEKAFMGLAFNVMELHRTERDSLNLDFLVSTKPEKL